MIYWTLKLPALVKIDFSDFSRHLGSWSALTTQFSTLPTYRLDDFEVHDFLVTSTLAQQRKLLFHP